MRGELRYRLAGVVGRAVLGTLFATTRFEVGGDTSFRALLARGQPVIYLLWHGRLLPLAYLHRRERIMTLASPSRDGEYIARFLAGWGYGVVRGSSSRRGAAAVRELVRHVRSGWSLAITPDGPRGPRQRMKLGPLVVAQLSGAPLVPVAAGTDRAWWFESWDRFLVPQPFARIRVAYGAPYEVPRDADEAELERRARVLEAELNRLVSAVDGGGRAG
ncbi:MAG TPA: lysophospholipid acyltransferase family protein [Longimicrobiales bacterium]|jgi:lysophospholipid acyltransferase (LPLAT)-like uncharacterized protein